MCPRAHSCPPADLLGDQHLALQWPTQHHHTPGGAALTVNYVVTGSATTASDYAALAGSVTIPAGAASAALTLTPINDTAVESDETVVLSLAASAGYYTCAHRPTLQ